MGFKRHLLVDEVDTMERALQLGNAYFQADGACWPGVTAQQVEADNEVSPSSAAAAVHVATAAADESTSLTMSMVLELLAEIRRLRHEPAVERLARSPTTAIGRRGPVCWGCGSGRHLLRSCPHGGRKKLNTNGPR